MFSPRKIIEYIRVNRIEPGPDLYFLGILAGLILVIYLLTTSAVDHDAISISSEPVAVEVGQEFTLSMRESRWGSTTWGLARPIDSALLQLVRSEYHVKSYLGGRRERQPDITRLTFKAMGAGQTTVNLVLLGGVSGNPDKKAFTIIVR